MQLSFFKDARYFQIIFQALFLAYGIFFLHWTAEWWLYATYFGTSIATQIICDIVLRKKFYWAHLKNTLPSVLISSFGLSLLLKTNDVEVAMFAAFVSIASKYIIRINGKHIFNPSALGIVAAIVGTGKAWINAGQWGSDVVLFFGVIILGLIVVTRVQKLDVSLAFLGTFGGLLFIRQIIYLGWPMDFFVQSISTGSVLLFSFFMITDPKTAPNHPIARISWAVCIAAVAFYLGAFKFINAAPVWVLVFSQPIVPLLDRIFKSKLFSWSTKFSSVSSNPVVQPVAFN